MENDTKLIKAEYNDEIHYFKTKNQCAVHFGINAGTIYNILEKKTKEGKIPKSNKCIGLKLSYIPYNKELTIEKQQDKRVGRRKIIDYEVVKEKRRIAARKFYAKQREKKILEKQEQEKKNIEI